MKLNLKMMLLFSAMMVVAVAVLSSYSTQLNIDSFTDLSKLQFDSISHTVSEALDQQLSLMDLVLDELQDNASFMAAINQFVRDDSDDQKVGTAARNTVLQQLYRSPLVENFYRVSFYTTAAVSSQAALKRMIISSAAPTRRGRSSASCPGCRMWITPLPSGTS